VIVIVNQHSLESKPSST